MGGCIAMPSLVLSGDTISVRLESKHLEVIRWLEKGNKIEDRIRVPIIDIDRVVIVGRPNVSIAVLQRLMFQGIPSYFLTSRGRWAGSITPDNNKNAFRRIRQYQLAGDDAFALNVARKLVYSKIRNSRRVLQRLSANRQESSDAMQERIDDELDTIANQSIKAQSVAELRGYEGIAAARYFARLGRFFPQNVPFNGRNRQPPKDPANALLSWTYTILLGEIDGAVRSHGMDACIGFLHEVSHGTPALSLDLLEPLRAPVCDLLVLNILNHNILKEDDFRYDVDADGFYLKNESHRSFFISYENSMTRKFSAVKGEAHTDFRRVINDAIVAVLHAMEGEQDFQFFLMP
jgi:CRISP-associated protein Cas1